MKSQGDSASGYTTGFCVTTAQFFILAHSKMQIKAFAFFTGTRIKYLCVCELGHCSGAEDRYLHCWLSIAIWEGHDGDSS